MEKILFAINNSNTELIDIFIVKDKYRPKVKVLFKDCNHICDIRYDHFIDSQKCNHKECKSKRNSKAQTLAWKNKTPEERERFKNNLKDYYNDSIYGEERRNKMSQSCKDAWNNLSEERKKSHSIKTSQNMFKNVDRDIFREHVSKSMLKSTKYFNGICESQRRKANKDEIYFKDLLEKHNIKYIWQDKFIEDRMLLVDFYLPDYDLKIDINGFIHECPEIFNTSDDEKIKLSKIHNIKYIQLKADKQELNIFIKNLIKEKERK